VEEAPLPPEEAAEPEDILGATPPAAEEAQPAAPEAAEASEEPERPRPTIEAPSEEEPGPAPPEPPEADVRSIRESLSLMESGSELESMTGEISGLLGQLSERARRYQNAWQTANQEAQDLKARLRSAERQVTLLKSEKGVMHEELLDTRARLEAAEEEAQALRKEDRNRIASLERELREKESRVSQLEGELETLNKELEEARGDVTSTSVQTRKARFELERAKNDLEAERQERIRIQRALEAREKEYQALMERGAGEASTLFMDELHRLVRRYENELNVRTGAARDALKALGRLSTDDANEREVSLVREGLETASGYYEGADELERLSREGNLPGGARSQRGEPASGEVRATKDDFSAALDRLDFEEVRRQASILMTAGKATPGELMRIAYGKSALHDRRMADHLVGLLALLRRLRDAQQELDRSRGAETDESECFYVRLFDLLHALVRAKVIGQGTPEPWDFFLELRGRFSYITSDAQWVAYRDKTLSEV
jgi:predicted  nucleic acid-binding Zn-ribbon protein